MSQSQSEMPFVNLELFEKSASRIQISYPRALHAIFIARDMWHIKQHASLTLERLAGKCPIPASATCRNQDTLNDLNGRAMWRRNEKRHKAWLQLRRCSRNLGCSKLGKYHQCAQGMVG